MNYHRVIITLTLTIIAIILMSIFAVDVLGVPIFPIFMVGLFCTCNEIASGIIHMIKWVDAAHTGCDIYLLTKGDTIRIPSRNPQCYILQAGQNITYTYNHFHHNSGCLRLITSSSDKGDMSYNVYVIAILVILGCWMATLIAWIIFQCIKKYICAYTFLYTYSIQPIAGENINDDV